MFGVKSVMIKDDDNKLFYVNEDITTEDGGKNIYMFTLESGLKLKIDPDSIVSIKSEGIYSIILYKENTLQCRFIERKSLKQWLVELDRRKFMQINRSNIVNVSYVDYVRRNIVLIGEQRVFIPHGKRRIIAKQYFELLNEY